MNKIIYSYFLGHPTSNACAKIINCKFIKLRGIKKSGKAQAIMFIIGAFIQSVKQKKKNNQIYFGEGITGMYLPYFMRLLKREKNKIILRMNDGSFNINKKTWLKKCFYKHLYKRIDGIIPISKLVEKDVKKQINVPSKISHTFLWRGFNYFSKLKQYNNRDVCFVGDYRAHKNIDFLAKVFILLKEKHKQNRNFNLVGENIQKNLVKSNLMRSYFICPGKTNPKKYFATSCFYIHLANYEAGGTAVIEAMATEIIPIVNEKVGNKDLVKQISEQLVITTTSVSQSAKKINKLINKIEKDTSLKKKLCKKSSMIAKKHNKKEGLVKFKNAFDFVLENIK